MNQYIKVSFLLHVFFINQTINLFAAEEGYSYHENPERSQENKPTQEKNALDALNKRHATEQKNLQEEYTQKQRDLRKEQVQKKQDLATTDKNVSLSGPARGKEAKTFQPDVVDKHYDAQSKKLDAELNQKTRKLREQQNNEHDTFVEEQLAANDALNAQFSSKLTTSKNLPETQTSLGDALDINNQYKKAKEKLKDAYDDQKEALQKKYETQKTKIAKTREEYRKQIETKVDGIHWAGDKITTKIDGKNLKGEQILDYYDKQLADLTTHYQTDQKQALDAYNSQVATQEKGRINKLKDIGFVDPTTKYIEDATEDSKQTSKTQTLNNPLTKTTPQEVDSAVHQLSNVIKDLTPKQKRNLREVVSSLQEQSSMGASLNDIIEKNKSGISEKLNLSESQIKNLEKNSNNAQISKGFFAQLLEFLKKIFSK